MKETEAVTKCAVKYKRARLRLILSMVDLTVGGMSVRHAPVFILTADNL